MLFTDVLVKNGIISRENLSKFSKKAHDDKIDFERLLIQNGVKSSDILKAKGEASGVPTAEITKGNIPYEVLKQIPEEAARHYKFVPLEIDEDTLQVGMVNPENIEAKEALQFIVSKLNLSFKIFLISEEGFKTVMDDYKGLRGEVTKVLGELQSALSETVKEVSISRGIEPKLETQFVEDAPVTKMVAVILKHAISGDASDIHIEPQKGQLKVRFRLDGLLYTSLLLPIEVHEAIVSRVKILTNMKLDEKRKPQDGRFEARIENREIDFRVSTLPTFYGEKVVMRVLDKTKGVKKLDQIGLEGRNLQVVQDALNKPYGLILITGPTGSGKSTTLYSMLMELDKEKYNVITLEDPVEYNIEGVSQSQIRPEIGYDFATGLRTILRQDPDMIMVGEIRDKETAALAIQAALTGHLVFATLHTNNAAGVIPRLVDMGVDPFLIAPTLLIAIAQRLARTLCENSRKEIPLIGKTKEKIDSELDQIPEELRRDLHLPRVVYAGLPSPSCPQGAKGRTAVFEVLEKTPELEDIILKNPVEPEIVKEGRRQGMLSVREDTLKKIFAGVVGLEELDAL